MAALVKANLPVPKLSAIATEGAPAMIGSENGLVGLGKGDQTLPLLLNFQYREQLLSNSLKLYNIMTPRMEIISYIRTHADHHTQFKNLIAELDPSRKATPT